MQFGISSRHARNLTRGAAVFLIAGTAAGCSSDVMRFDGGFSAMNRSNQPQQQQLAAQAYPQQQQTYQQAAAQYPAGVDRTSTGSIGRSVNAHGHPVPNATVGSGVVAATQPYPLPQRQQQVAAAPTQPFPTASAPVSSPVRRQQLAAPAAAATGGVDRMSTGSVNTLRTPAPAAQPVVAAAPANGRDGWTAQGGTAVIVKQGETVQALSRRYGVPAEAIWRVNGLNQGQAVASGQTVVIPAFARGGVPVQQTPNVAAVQPMPVPASPGKAPTPAGAPDRVAVLPTDKRLGQKQAPQPAGANTGPQANTGATSGSVYTVQSGDTLNGIAGKLGTTSAALKQANKMDGGLVRVGQKLVVPGGIPAKNDQVAAVKAPQGVDPITTGTTKQQQPKPQNAGYTPPAKAVEAVASVAPSTPAPDASGASQMRWPVRGRVVSAYGAGGGKKNDGIDIAVPEGTSVKAAENGVVIYAGDGLKDFGNTVLVRHENGLVTVYGHASAINVKRGETVRRGQEIARSGMSGNAQSPKLHFEVRKDSAPVDPSKFLE